MRGGAAHFSWLLPQPPLCPQSRQLSPEAPHSLQAGFSFSGFPWGYLVRCWGPPHAPAWFPEVWQGGTGVAGQPGTTGLSPYMAFDDRARDLVVIPWKSAIIASSNHLKPAQCCLPEHFSLLPMKE